MLTSQSRWLVTVVPLVLVCAGCGSSSSDPNPSDVDAGTQPGADAGGPDGAGDDAGNDGGGDDAAVPSGPRLTPPADLGADPAPQATDVGYELGDAVTREIGPAGGTISFGADGPTIDVPAGALAETVEISIQQIVNHAPHRIGAAYRFGPAGTTFTTPVTVTFPLPAVALESGATEGVGVAFQDDAGFWKAIPDVTVDAAGKKVTAKTSHFSDWTLFQQTELRPAISSVQVNGSLGLWVYQCTAAIDPDTLLAPLVPSCKAATGFTTWSVNGIASGNAAVGTTTPLPYGAAYTAPASKPSPNPVAVSVEVPMGARKGLLVAHVRVTDDDTCTFEKPCNWTGTSQWEQTSTSTGGFAHVRWVVDSKDEDRKLVFYRPEGKVWYWDHETHCVPRDLPLDLSTRSDERENLLVIDYSGSTPTVSITDSVAAWSSIPMSCPGEPPTGPFDTYFADGEPELAEEGTAIVAHAVDESIGLVRSFRFTRE